MNSRRTFLSEFTPEYVRKILFSYLEYLHWIKLTPIDENIWQTFDKLVVIIFISENHKYRFFPIKAYWRVFFRNVIYHIFGCLYEIGNFFVLTLHLIFFVNLGQISKNVQICEILFFFCKIFFGIPSHLLDKNA